MAIVLIVGGAGFIGSHLVDRCLEEHHAVHVITKPTTDLYRLEGHLDCIHVHQLDINNHGALEPVLGEIKPELIYHLAIATRRKTMPHLGDAFASVKEDVLGLLSVLAAAEASGTPRMFISTGSLAAYGRTPASHVESAREVPQSVYAAGLVAGVHYVEALQARLPFPVITARLSLVNQSDEFFIPSMIKQCLTGRASVVQNPHARRDLIYVDDAVDALQTIAESNLPGWHPRQHCIRRSPHYGRGGALHLECHRRRSETRFLQVSKPNERCRSSSFATTCEGTARMVHQNRPESRNRPDRRLVARRAAYGSWNSCRRGHAFSTRRF